ncbi:succinate dehydrogenase cytochrome b560 subunit [Grosmannia clavigera kw1407]|uniref:Succinate dehydrogenase cytochrome b560 subunit n=1 Tax=Grosmannia clavigera (strain kw1407 / UAMH 11150) TaxID=655863 RepID=F0XJN7_GROCL|nr:succinate dehydrogenase cytochrome b560 subunit [Grosmannia clavigera kw1407]EFX02247.1 succinate dehydrogenase cytochrome b560 subunit [Grosmannia clavigera kw1407]
MVYPYSYPTQPTPVYQYAPGHGSTSTGHGVRQHQTTASTTYPLVYSTPSAPLYYPRVPAGPMPALPPYTYYPQHVSSGMYGPAAPPHYQQQSGGGVFNRWPGAPEEEEVRAEDRTRRRSRRGHRSRQERGHRSHSPSRSGGSNSYYDSRDGGYANENEGEDDDVVFRLHDDVFYDEDDEEHVDTRLRAHNLAVAGREEVAYGRGDNDDDDDEADDVGELVREVAVHPGGSGRVVLHVDSEPPRLTSFRVSARRMRSEARSWTQVCHRGTNACDTTVADETAVAGMYWLLRVLHDEPEVRADGASGHQDHHAYEARLHNLVVQGAVPVPRELPARVLAYVVMFGQQLGALGRPGSMGGGGRPSSRLRTQSEAWLWAIMSRRRDRHVLDASAVDDWPFLLYASRSLDNQDLVRRCLQMLTWDRQRNDWLTMNAQRVGVMALRRAAAKPSVFSPQVARALALRAVQTRSFTTEKLTPEQANALLASQRLQRPVSPHLDIYDKRQIYFGASILHRFTGLTYAGLLYGGSLAYLAAPLLGWHLESQSLVTFAAGLPLALKGVAKFALAWPLAFHFFNGARHLVWDAAVGFSKAEIAKGTTAIWVLSVVSSLGLAFLW